MELGLTGQDGPGIRLLGVSLPGRKGAPGLPVAIAIGDVLGGVVELPAF